MENSDILKIKNLFHKFEKNNTILVSEFLDLATQQRLKELYNSKECPLIETSKYIEPNEQTFFFGGYDNSERKMLFIIPEYIKKINVQEYIKILRIKANNELSHRDYLGSVIGIGISRGKIGDIIVNGEEAFIFVDSNISTFIELNLKTVGSSRVRIELVNFDEIPIKKEKIKTIKGTVASLRLDSVTKLGFGYSRQKIVQFIENGRIFVDSVNIIDKNFKIVEGNVISARGLGKMKLNKVLANTKKDRIMIEIMRWI